MTSTLDQLEAKVNQYVAARSASPAVPIKAETHIKPASTETVPVAPAPVACVVASMTVLDKPLLVPIPEACRPLGGIRKTAFYSAVERHSIKLVRLGGRSMVPTAEIERVVAELVADCGAADQVERARDLASKSVAVRRVRRGNST